MMRTLIRCGALAGAIGLGACDRTVVNPVSPGTERVLKTPADVENLLSSQYLRWHNGLYVQPSAVGCQEDRDHPDE